MLVLNVVNILCIRGKPYRSRASASDLTSRDARITSLELARVGWIFHFLLS